MRDFNHSRLLARLLVSASAPVALLATPAIAQQAAQPATTPAPAAPAETTGTPDIIVTAQFRGQRIQDVPLAITAMDSALIEARSQDNIAQVAKNTPSVVVIPGGGAFGPSIGASIRGVGNSTSTRPMSPAWASTSTMSITRR